jgi:hypothetical protein
VRSLVAAALFPADASGSPTLWLQCQHAKAGNRRGYKYVRVQVWQVL